MLNLVLVLGCPGEQLAPAEAQPGPLQKLLEAMANVPSKRLCWAVPARCCARRWVLNPVAFLGSARYGRFGRSSYHSWLGPSGLRSPNDHGTKQQTGKG